MTTDLYGAWDGPKGDRSPYHLYQGLWPLWQSGQHLQPSLAARNCAIWARSFVLPKVSSHFEIMLGLEGSLCPPGVCDMGDRPLPLWCSLLFV